VKSVSIPWSVWYEDTHLELTFPDGWEVTVAHMRGGPDVGDEGMRRALAEPIGAPRLRELARGRRDAAILVDDLCRPTPAYRVLPYILEELNAAGLGDDKVKVICAVAAHRPLTRQDMLKKLGPELVERLHVLNHNAYDNLEFYGHSSQGIPVWVNREFARSDLKIAAGMITPRGNIFGGGAKLVLPGVAGRQTIYANHRYCPGKVFRQHLDEVARMVGLDYVVNPLLNGDKEIIALVAGHPQEAFWRGVEQAMALYRTEVPEGMDVLVCNAWPKDTEATQATLALIPLYDSMERALARNGSVVITTASPEGLGFHSVLGPGTLLRGPAAGFGARLRARGAVQQILFSPNLNKHDSTTLYGDTVTFCREWDQVLGVLKDKHGSEARVGVLPYGALQYGV
jgi:nickel-dependent lactate racemase